MCVCCCLLSILILLAMRITPVKLWWERVQGSFNRACQCGTDENTLVSKNSFDAGTQENRRRTLAHWRACKHSLAFKRCLWNVICCILQQPSLRFRISSGSIMTSRNCAEPRCVIKKKNWWRKQLDLEKPLKYGRKLLTHTRWFFTRIHIEVSRKHFFHIDTPADVTNGVIWPVHSKNGARRFHQKNCHWENKLKLLETKHNRITIKPWRQTTKLHQHDIFLHALNTSESELANWALSYEVIFALMQSGTFFSSRAERERKERERNLVVSIRLLRLIS